MTVNTEELIELTGGCGVFQIILVVAVNAFCRSSALWGVDFMSFGNYNPGWVCSDISHNSSFTYYESEMFNSSLSINFTEQTQAQCFNLKQCPTVTFKPNGRTILSEWALVCDKSWILSLMTSVQMFGQLVGSTCGGYWAENKGRRNSFYGNVMLYAVANLMTTFSNSWQMFTVMRFFIGFGVGGIIPTAFIYTMEFLNSKWRGIVGGLPIIHTGLVVFAFVVYLEQDWKLVHISTAVFAFIGLLTYPLVPESMRWLALHGECEKAKKIACKIAKYNGTPTPKMEALNLATNATNDNTKTNYTYSYLDLFRERKTRAITIKLCALWLFTTIPFYSIKFSIGALPGDFYINFIMFNSFEIPSVALSGIAANKLGRVKSGAIYIALAVITCACATFVSMRGASSSHHGVILVISLVLSTAFINGSRGINNIIASELTPTTIRALGHTFYTVVSRIGAIIAPFLVAGPILSLNMILILLGTFLIISLCVMLSLPETKDKNMPDVVGNGIEIKIEDHNSIIPEESFVKRDSESLASNEQTEPTAYGIRLNNGEKTMINSSHTKYYMD